METNEQPVVRPWQGTCLGVFNIIWACLLGFIFLLILLTIFGGASFLGALEGADVSIAGMLGMFGTFFLVPIGLILLLEIFIIKGIFKGKKWAVIVCAIFTGLFLLSAMINIAIFSVLLNGFFLYTEIICIKHPFYNQKN